MELQTLNLLQGIKQKVVDPKIYAIVLKGRVTEVLYHGIHYTLEDALENAILRAKGLTSPISDPERDWHILMFSTITLDQLKENVIQGKIEISDIKNDESLKDDTPVLKEISMTKNQLMKEIITSKNRGVFEMNKSIFNENEIKLLEEELKKK